MQKEVIASPGLLFDTLIDRLNLRNDAALARALGVAQTILSKMRRGTLDIGAKMILHVHQESGLSIKEIRALIGEVKIPPKDSEPLVKLNIREELKKQNQRVGVSRLSKTVMADALAEIERLDALLMAKEK